MKKEWSIPTLEMLSVSETFGGPGKKKNPPKHGQPGKPKHPNKPENAS